MKKIALFISLISISLLSFAQAPAQGAGLQQRVGGTGRIYGKLIDADGKTISKASVFLMKNTKDTLGKSKQVLFKSALSQANGDFAFEDVPAGSAYVINVSSTAYKAFTQTVKFAAEDKLDKNIGSVVLTAGVKDLDAVVVTAVTPTVKFSGDKKIFNVEKNIMSAGGTGVDVMRNVPSVNVDIDGNITLRNSAPQLLVDGRPTTLTLDQIPADAIETVEVISNPSAKYDASGGGGGILNIVLKKNKKSGYNGNVRAGVNKRGAMNGGADFNVRQGKINLSASVNGNQNKERTTGETTRHSLLSYPQVNTTQNNYNRTTGGFVFAKLGLDYFVTNRTTLSFSGIRVHGEFKPNETIDIFSDSLYTSGKVSEASQRFTTGTREFNGKGLVFGMKHTFAKKGEELTVDANYFGGENANNTLYTTNYLTSGYTTLQKQLGSGSDKNFTIQSDYVLPVGKTGKIETGVRAQIRSRVNVNDNYIYDNAKADYTLIPSATSHYKNTDNVYAAYGTYSNNIKDLSYKVGVRAERTDYTGTLTSTGQQFKNKYPVSLFPSVFLSQKLNNKQELQLSYSRRINRPNFFQLIPFTDYTDKLNITRGNPNLVPEFAQSLELSYLKTFPKNNTLLGSVYYKHTDNLITRYLTSEADPITGTTDLINTYINANSSYAAGAELTAVNNITKWWDISTNVNVYNSKVNTDNVKGDSQAALWSWFGKFNSNFKLPSNFAIQYTATYQSKTNLPVSSGGGGMGGPGMQQSQSASQGYIKSFWGMDLAVKKSFLKNNAASIGVSITDIFKTRINSQYSSSDYFTQDYSRLRDPQMVKVNLSYRFGKQDALLFKRKSSGGDGSATENSGF